MQLDRRQIVKGITATLLPCYLLSSAASGQSSNFISWLHEFERKRIMANAVKWWQANPITVTSFKAARSPGDKHAYYSEGDYWWRDPANPDGAYVRRDGYSNPDRFDAHRQALIRLSLIVPALVAAWRVTHERKFANAALRHLNAWFVDSETRMTANLEHAQAIIGVNTGRGIGIIDTLQLVEVAKAASTLGERYHRQISPVRAWFSEYLDWMMNSENGRDEQDEKNNHGSCYVLQIAAFAELTGNDNLAGWSRDRFRNILVPTQIALDGSQPLELARTKPFGYCLFNLDILSCAAHLLSNGTENLWEFETTSGQSLSKALAFMAPFIANKNDWPYQKDVEYWDDWPVRHPSLLFGGVAHAGSAFISLWQTLSADPRQPEIIRNYPVRQPVLWFD